MPLDSVLKVDVNALPQEEKIELFLEGVSAQIDEISKLLKPYVGRREKPEIASLIASVAVSQVVGDEADYSPKTMSSEEMTYYIRRVGELKLMIAKSPGAWVKWYHTSSIVNITRIKNDFGRPLQR